MLVVIRKEGDSCINFVREEGVLKGIRDVEPPLGMMRPCRKIVMAFDWDIENMGERVGLCQCVS